MAQPPGGAATRAAVPGGVPRLLGVDVARALALLAMMATHLVPETGADGRQTLTGVLFAGRASALFATLAGVSLALATAGPCPRVDAGARAAVAVRAVLVAALGLLLVELDPPVAVILTNYGLLFLLALPVLTARPRPLLAAAGCWLVAAPVLSQLSRARLAPGPGPQPSLAGLAHPAEALEVLERLAVTGYYPVLTWAAYLLAGLAVGRLRLADPRVARRLLAAGAGTAAAAWVASAALVHAGWGRLVAAGPADQVLAPLGATQLELRGHYGTTPTTSWWWLAVVSPHTGTPFDLAQTLGCALAVLGGCLLVVPALGRARVGRRLPRGLVLALAATGSTTLTLYALHVVAADAGWGPVEPHRRWLLHAVLAVVLASLWRQVAPRGPLEALVAAAAGAARSLVRRLAGRPRSSPRAALPRG